MIEVTLRVSGKDGDGSVRYLIDIPTESSNGEWVNPFKSRPTAQAIRRALTEYEKDHPEFSITSVDIRTTPDKVLEV